MGIATIIENHIENRNATKHDSGSPTTKGTPTQQQPSGDNAQAFL